MGDKMRINFGQIIFISIIVPVIFGVSTPITEDAGEPKTGLLAVFFKSGYFRGLFDILKDVVGFVQKWVDTAADYTPDPEFLPKLWQLVIGSAVGAAVGGLCVMMVFYIWKFIIMIPALEFFHGIWPVFPAVAAAYAGCCTISFAENNDGFDINKVMYYLAAVNFLFILIRILFFHTSVVWQIVKGIFSAILGCAVSAVFSCLFCIYAMMAPFHISGTGAYILLFTVSIISGVLVYLEDILVDTAEKHSGKELL